MFTTPACPNKPPTNHPPTALHLKSSQLHTRVTGIASSTSPHLHPRLSEDQTPTPTPQHTLNNTTAPPHLHASPHHPHSRAINTHQVQPNPPIPTHPGLEITSRDGSGDGTILHTWGLEMKIADAHPQGVPIRPSDLSVVTGRGKLRFSGTVMGVCVGCVACVV
jgi:hypothetical protein